MTEHVCPVGALTSEDFRFKARVWFLRSARTICQGCATGCNAFLDYDPRTNVASTATDRGRTCGQQILDVRRRNALVQARGRGPPPRALVGGEDATIEDALGAASDQFKGHGNDPSRVAMVLSAQHSNEDNFALVALAKTFLGASGLLRLRSSPRSRRCYPDERGQEPQHARRYADGRLTPPRPIADLLRRSRGRYAYVIALGSELEVEATEARGAWLKLKALLTIAAHDGPLAKAAHITLPACAWAEADGTYVNRHGTAQRSERALGAHGDARPGWAPSSASPKCSVMRWTGPALGRASSDGKRCVRECLHRCGGAGGAERKRGARLGKPGGERVSSANLRPGARQDRHHDGVLSNRRSGGNVG